MRLYDVVVLTEADADIARNAEWWAKKYSVRQAEAWFYAVYDQLKELRQYPESYALSPESEDFPFEIRDKPVGLGQHRSHRAIFTIRGDVAYVIAVMRGSQDRLRPDDVDFP